MLEVSLEEVLKFYDDVMPIRVPCYNSMINIIAKLAIGQRGKNLAVVDLGIGTGNLEEKMLSERRDMTILGYDYSAEMLDFASRKLSAFRDRLELVQLDFAKQPVPNTSKCDVVVSNLTIHSLPDDIKSRVFQSVSDILKDDGVLILGDKFKSKSEMVDKLFNEFSDEWRDNAKKGWTKREYEKYESIWKLQGDEREYVNTLEQYDKILRDIGFKEIECICKFYCYGILYVTK